MNPDSKEVKRPNQSAHPHQKGQHGGKSENPSETNQSGQKNTTNTDRDNSSR